MSEVETSIGLYGPQRVKVRPGDECLPPRVWIGNLSIRVDNEKAAFDIGDAFITLGRLLREKEKVPA